MRSTVGGALWACLAASLVASVLAGGSIHIGCAACEDALRLHAGGVAKADLCGAAGLLEIAGPAGHLEAGQAGHHGSEVLKYRQHEIHRPTMSHVDVAVLETSEACDAVLAALDDSSLAKLIREDVYGACMHIGLCPKEDFSHLGGPDDATVLEPRITPAFGARAGSSGLYRVSLITNMTSPAPESQYFQYSQPFRYRWKQFRLSSGLVKLNPGPQTLDLAGIKLNLNIPAENEGVRGIIIADPCYSSRYIVCSYGNRLKTFERIPALLNAALRGNNNHYWMILGDNFYDREGFISDNFFAQLSLDVKSKIFASTPGNHDYWVKGAPELGAPEDSYGNGFMQYYAQDTLASYSMNSTTGEFLDFSVDPDNGTTVADRRPPPHNFFWYNKIGNIGFIGFSGAYDFTTSKPYFEEACDWLSKANVAAAFIAGHWNEANAGCPTEMDVPAVFSEIKGISGCAALGDRLKYIMGHTHCNKVTETINDKATGFMVAGMGMIGCGNFGIPYIDSTNGRLEVLYFPIGDYFSADDRRYKPTLECFQQHGIENCKHLADVWLNQTLPAL